MPLAEMSTGGAGAPFLRRWSVILLGPIAGWIPAIASHQVGQGLGLLLVTTLACAVPLGAYVPTRHPGWLCVAGIAWVISGWILGVAIWV